MRQTPFRALLAATALLCLAVTVGCYNSLDLGNVTCEPGRADNCQPDTSVAPRTLAAPWGVVAGRQTSPAERRMLRV